ncbi:MAG TPA: nucleotidyltransferase domain-containing protein [Nitrospirae bacterium]|nr:nucleotidyltransferase domain-containing protein [Nitrospirota bacterium]HDZ87854.1 nucleotidyltransferase domain-containing protein [Nitrospirota bacterium]
MEVRDIKNIAERYGITMVYLFGSRTDEGSRFLKGEDVRPGALSDLDVAVAFEKPPSETMRVYGLLYKEISKLFDPFEIDLLFMHEHDAIFQYEIIKGVRIFEKDTDSADEFEEIIMKRAEDLIFKKRLLNREIMEAIEDGYFEFEYSPNP